MKLEIPGDNTDHTDDTTISFELSVGLALAALLILIGWMFWIQPQQGQPDPTVEVDTDGDRPTIASRSDDRGPDHDFSADTDPADWDERSDELAAVFEAGPRKAAEAACRRYADDIEHNRLPRDAARTLRQGVSRLSGAAPVGCLTRLYLEDRLDEDAELTYEFEQFFAGVATFDAHGEAMAIVVEEFADDGLPESERFERWLRRCALTMHYDAAPACRRIAQEHFSDDGADLMELLLVHLADTDDDADEVHERYDADLELTADALGYFARYGQPDDWHIEETDELPDYNVDFRLAAVFQLCRMMNAPDEQVQTWAADALGYIAGVAARPHNPHMHYRWRASCRLAFGDPDDAQQYVPALGVAMLDGDEQTVDYGLDTLVDHDHCELRDGYPDWFCGSQRWTGGPDSIRSVLGHYFARTGYVEWYELDELAEVMPQE